MSRSPLPDWRGFLSPATEHPTDKADRTEARFGRSAERSTDKADRTSGTPPFGGFVSRLPGGRGRFFDETDRTPQRGWCPGCGQGPGGGGELLLCGACGWQSPRLAEFAGPIRDDDDTDLAGESGDYPKEAP